MADVVAGWLMLCHFWYIVDIDGWCNYHPGCGWQVLQPSGRWNSHRSMFKFQFWCSVQYLIPYVRQMVLAIPSGYSICHLAVTPANHTQGGNYINHQYQLYIKSGTTSTIWQQHQPLAITSAKLEPTSGNNLCHWHNNAFSNNQIKWYTNSWHNICHKIKQKWQQQQPQHWQ